VRRADFLQTPVGSVTRVMQSAAPLRRTLKGINPMGNLSAKVAQRIAMGIKKFQPILVSAKARDINESDTVIIVTDTLQEVFGYEKFTDITSEHMIRGTFCDLAIS
jgi:hypothetical protein